MYLLIDLSATFPLNLNHTRCNFICSKLYASFLYVKYLTVCFLLQRIILYSTQILPV
jgi:hypothetical protein